MYRYDSFWHSSRVYTYVKMSISMVMQQKGKIYGSFCFVRLERHTSSLFLQSNVMFFSLFESISRSLHVDGECVCVRFLCANFHFCFSSFDFVSEILCLRNITRATLDRMCAYRISL